jgi:hypothetical protein
MDTYDDLAKLAQLCAKQARFTFAKDAAATLWELALEYQYKAAARDSGRLPEIGSPPSWLTTPLR